MIEINGTSYAWNDPLVLAVAGAVITFLFLIVLLRAVLKTGKSIEPMMMQMGQLGQAVQGLNSGQERLTGNLEGLSQVQNQTIQTMEMRLADVQRQMAEKLHETQMKSARSLSDLQERMNDTLHGSSEKTTKSLTQLQERLATIDRAQSNIEKLSGDVLSLQDILSNKQRRGMFGEIQLNDIVSKALPADAYQMQATLSNGKRADCLIHLPNPPGPIVIDAKFPFEAFELLAAAEGPEQTKRALREFGNAVRVHIKAISEKYILDGETADGALMFLPSEAIYAELHARLPDVVREGFAARVWIVSPTTCMATLNTMRAILKDARMREQAGAIRRELGLLYKDVDRLGTRVENLDRHFGQAAKDISEIKISAEKAGSRARRLDTFEFDEPQEAIDSVPPVARIGEP